MEVRSDPPLTLRNGLDGLQWVGSSAGPLQGDDLRLDLHVGPDASLTVGSVAAMLVQPGVVPTPSVLLIDVDVRHGGSLRWTPQPTVAVRGCDHEGVVRLRLAADAELVWRDELVLGRHGEPSGSIRQRLIVDLDGRPLVRNDIAVGPRWPGSLGPAGVGRATQAVGSVLVVGRRLIDGMALPARRPGVRAAAMPLEGPAVIVTAVSASVPAVRAVLDEVVASLPSPHPAGSNL